MVSTPHRCQDWHQLPLSSLIHASFILIAQHIIWLKHCVFFRTSIQLFNDFIKSMNTWIWEFFCGRLCFIQLLRIIFRSTTRHLRYWIWLRVWMSEWVSEWFVWYKVWSVPDWNETTRPYLLGFLPGLSVFVVGPGPDARQNILLLCFNIIILRMVIMRSLNTIIFNNSILVVPYFLPVHPSLVMDTL